MGRKKTYTFSERKTHKKRIPELEKHQDAQSAAQTDFELFETYLFQAP